MIYCLWIEWQVFPFADKINKLPEKTFLDAAINKNMREAKKMFIFPHRTWKDNIRFVILDWRQRSSSRSHAGKRHACLSTEGRDPLVTQADLSAPRVSSPAVTLLHKKGPRHRRKICANSLWLYSYYTQASPTKNKNTNHVYIYIYIYLRVLRCLSSGAIMRHIFFFCMFCT